LKHKTQKKNCVKNKNNGEENQKNKLKPMKCGQARRQNKRKGNETLM
jgi:hypothetical protein